MPDPDPVPPGPEALARGPGLYPLDADAADAVRFVPLTAADYARASFLDARLAVPAATGNWLQWPAVRAATAGLPVRCHFIFHISHVGSTLLSRLVGLHPAFFSVREPALLRTLSDAHLLLGRPEAPWPAKDLPARTRALLALWSRTFTPGQTAVIKATSHVSEMAADLLGTVPTARALFLYVSPPTFLAALLGGAIGDATGSAAKRLYRLHRRLGAAPWRAADLSPGECVAAAWLCEMLSLCAAAAAHPGRARWLDFDRFLADPRPELRAVVAHFGADAAAADGLLDGPTMTQYAKGPTQAYDAGVRAALLVQSERQNRAEIDRGLAWLRAAGAVPGVRETLHAGRPGGP